MCDVNSALDFYRQIVFVGDVAFDVSRDIIPSG